MSVNGQFGLDSGVRLPNGARTQNTGGYEGARTGNGETGLGNGANGGSVGGTCSKDCQCDEEPLLVPCIGGRSFNPTPDGGGGGVPNSGSTCLAEGTILTTESGATKLIEDVKVGDKIAGINCARDHSLQTVVRAESFESKILRVIAGGHSIVCTKSHLFMGEGMHEVPASELSLGSKILSGEGSLVVIELIEELDESKTVYAIEVHPDHMFLASGLVHHNKVICFENTTSIPDPF